jgi:hypothetical protein
MYNTYELFSLMRERDSTIFWFLNELNLTYQRLTSFVASFDFIPIMLMPWGRFSLCHTPIKPLLAFQDQISIFIVGYMIMKFSSPYEANTLIFFFHSSPSNCFEKNIRGNNFPSPLEVGD